MAGRDRDEEPQGPSAEERIAKLEKGRLINWIIMGVLLLLLIVQGVFLILIGTQGPDPRVNDHEQRISILVDEVERLEAAYETAEAYNENAQRLEDKLDRIMKTIQLNNFSALRKLMIEQEESWQQFLATLKQGMYDISRMVKGSRTWYEVYKEDLDLVTKDSQHRSERLGTGLVETGNKRETVKP